MRLQRFAAAARCPRLFLHFFVTGGVVGEEPGEDGAEPGEDGAAGFGAKFAVTVLSAPIVIVHWLALALSQPVQPEKLEPASGVAVSVTIAPEA